MTRTRNLIVLFAACCLASAQPLWKHLSSKRGDLPSPDGGKQQTAALVADLDNDGVNDFVITERTASPSAVWYRRMKSGWTRYVLDDTPLRIEAGGAAWDIDGDGDLDIVFGGDARSNEVWWWENPRPRFDPNTPWTRRFIKNTGANKHHDQLFADFDGDGAGDLVFWNQGARKLFFAPIPADPKNTQPWPIQEIFSWEGGECEGLAQADVNGDGKLDIVGGGRWFEHASGLSFRDHLVDDTQRFSRAAAGQLVKGGWLEIVFVVGDGNGPLKWYEWTGKAWQPHDLLGADVIHGHSLQVADIDRDGNLDIFSAEMGKWTNAALEADNPSARIRIFYGDGKGNFRLSEVSSGIGVHEARLADLDGDGDLDILGKPYNFDTPRLDVWLNAPPILQ